MLGLKNFDFSQKRSKAAGEKVQVYDFSLGMAKGIEPRSEAQVLLLHLGIRLRYLVESWFFLKPLFASRLSAYPSFLRPEGIPEVDWLTLFLIRCIWIISGQFATIPPLKWFLVQTGIMGLLKRLHATLMDRIVKIMKNSDMDWEKARGISIPEYDWKNGSSTEFYETYMRRPHPVILRGFMEGTELMDLTFDNLMDRFGDDEVVLTSKKDGGRYGKLTDVNKPNNYLQNSEALFNKHPELRNLLQTERLEPYSHMKASFAQIFVGRKGTGAPMHNAYAWNFFYMVDGMKKWYFVEPDFFYLAYPKFIAGATSGWFFNLYPDVVREDITPAMKYCPYFVAELKPGDVLLNPAYWGHGIRNTTDKSVGIASRWTPGGIMGKDLKHLEDDYELNRFASFNFMSGWKSFPTMQMQIREICPQFDEHISLREVGASVALAIQTKRSEGKANPGEDFVPF